MPSAPVWTRAWPRARTRAWTRTRVRTRASTGSVAQGVQRGQNNQGGQDDQKVTAWQKRARPSQNGRIPSDEQGKHKRPGNY